MKSANKRDLITAIDASTEELHQRIDMHRYLISTIWNQQDPHPKGRKISPGTTVRTPDKADRLLRSSYPEIEPGVDNISSL